MSKLFNERAANEAGIFYGEANASVEKASSTIVERAISLIARGEGDRSMFPTGVKMDYSDAPSLIDDVKFSKAGDPSNPFVPDLRSPGATGVDGVVNVDPKARANDPELSIAAVKPNMIVGVPQKFDADAGTVGTGTVSPASTSSTVGKFPIGQELQKGKASIS